MRAKVKAVATSPSVSTYTYTKEAEGQGREVSNVNGSRAKAYAKKTFNLVKRALRSYTIKIIAASMGL
jgi:hypothetical protein